MQTFKPSAILCMTLLLFAAASLHARTDTSRVYIGGLVLTDKDGGRVPLSGYEGTVTVLYLWAHG